MFVTDTHPLLWYISGDNSKISGRVRDIFEKTKTAETYIYVPVVVFWEIALLEKLGRIKLKNASTIGHKIFSQYKDLNFCRLPST